VASYERQTFLHVALGKQNNNRTRVGEGSGRSNLKWCPSQRPQHGGGLGPRRPKASAASSTAPPAAAGQQSSAGSRTALSPATVLAEGRGRCPVAAALCSQTDARKGLQSLDIFHVSFFSCLLAKYAAHS